MTGSFKRSAHPRRTRFHLTARPKNQVHVGEPAPPMKSRSPRVVAIGRKFSSPSTVGERISPLVMPISIQHMRRRTRPRAWSRPSTSTSRNPQTATHRSDPRFAMWLRTNQITIAPGTMVSTPAAASPSPCGRHGARHRRRRSALAFTLVSVRASSNSTQREHEAEERRHADAALISGMKIVRKKRGKAVAVDVDAVSSISRGMPLGETFRIHTASGTLNSRCASATAIMRVHQAHGGVELKNGSRTPAAASYAVRQQ